MPSTAKRDDYSVIFFPYLILLLIMWVLYRQLFAFPVWFDETVGKAIFFGLPVWIFVTATQMHQVTDTFSIQKLKPGLLLGIAVGGLFGFVGSLLALAQRGGVVDAVWLFNYDVFWQEFILAMLTGFWETLLFFSLVMTMVMHRFKKWSLLRQILLVATIFLAFHIPNIFLRFPSINLVIGQMALLFLFAIGQAYLFAIRKNGYALVLSHAIWGMVLLIHAW